MSDENIIVVGAGEKDYWGRIEDGVVVDIIVAARNPRTFGGIDENIIPRLQESFPDSLFVVLPMEPVRPGIGWLYDAATEAFTPPAVSPEPPPSPTDGVVMTPLDPSSVEFAALVRQVRETLKAEVLAEVMAELETGNGG